MVQIHETWFVSAYVCCVGHPRHHTAKTDDAKAILSTPLFRFHVRQCSEGVSFLSVRKTYLADVPVSPSGFIQQCLCCRWSESVGFWQSCYFEINNYNSRRSDGVNMILFLPNVATDYHASLVHVCPLRCGFNSVSEVWTFDPHVWT